ncbi:MAG: hypothetical protein ACNA8W_06170 [Bradymonadaceae bacterium]
MKSGSTVVVERVHGMGDKLRAYVVEIDGEPKGKLTQGQRVVIDVPPGRHQIRVTIDWCSSKTIDFELLPGQRRQFWCGSNITGWRLLFVMLYVLVLRDEYLWLATSLPGQNEQKMLAR